MNARRRRSRSPSRSWLAEARDCWEKSTAAGVAADEAYRRLADGLYAALLRAAGDEVPPSPFPEVESWLSGRVFVATEDFGDDDAGGGDGDGGETRPIGPAALGELAEALGYADAVEDARTAGGGRRDAGAWYTPPAERLLIFRLALADWLSAREAGETVAGAAADGRTADWFAWIGGDESAAEFITPARAAWLVAGLSTLTVYDPACGAGGFLLTAGRELRRLTRRARVLAGTPEPEDDGGGGAPGRLHGDDIAPAALCVAARRLALSFGDADLRHSAFDFRLSASGSVAVPKVESRKPNAPEAFPASLAVLRCRDALGGGDGDGGRFDIVIGNPPYVQYKRIRPPRVAGTASPPVDAAGYRAELRRRVWAADPGFWASGAAVFDGRADLCLYFHFLGFSRLRPGGVLALLTAESWLDVDGGHAWQAYMLARGVGRRLVGHGRRQSFAGADVDTLLLFLRRPADVDVDAAAGPCREPVLFMQIDGDYAAALSPSRWRAPLAAGGGGAGSAGGWVWKTVAVDELWNEGGLAAAAKSGGPSDEALNSVIPDDGFFCERPRGSAQPGLFADNSLRERGPYRGGKWGGRHLRNLLPESGENAATPDLPTTTDPRLCALAELARIVTGIKEGGYKRYLRPRPRAGGNTAAAADDASPPPELAGGVLKDPRRHSRPGLDAPDADLVAAEAGAKVLAKAARGGAPLLWLAGRGATHKAWWNPAGHPFTGNFLGLWPEPSVDALPLLAALNSLWTAWRSEAAARGKGIGGAACVFTAGDLRAVAVPDLRTLSPDDRRVWSGWGREMLSWPFEPLLTRAEAFAGPGGAADSSPWTRFDLFVFDFLGLAAPAGRAIAADLRARLLRRRGKANAT